MKFHRVYVEVTNICGLSCSFCPPKHQSTETMTNIFFENVLQQLRAYTDEIALHVMGDPMVLSDLNTYLDAAKRQNMRVVITTSGFYMDSKRAQTLFHPAVKQVNISLNSFNKNTTSRSLREYLEPILVFCEEKIDRGSDFFVNLRLWNLDEAGYEADYNRELFTIFEQRFAFPSGSIQERASGLRQGVRLASKVLLHFDRYFEWPSLDLPVIGDGFCHGLSSQIAILSDGRVVPCCLDAEGYIELGNIKETNLDKILSSKRAVAIREGFSSGKAVEELCQKCSYKERFKGKERS